MDFTKKELIEYASNYFNKPKSYYKDMPKDALIYLMDEIIAPDIMASNCNCNEEIF